jgi:hypothetical protein
MSFEGPALGSNILGNARPGEVCLVFGMLNVAEK